MATLSIILATACMALLKIAALMHYAYMNQTNSRSCDSSSMRTPLFNLYPG